MDSYSANYKIMHLMTSSSAMNEGLRGRKNVEKPECIINHRRISETRILWSWKSRMGANRDITRRHRNLSATVMPGLSPSYCSWHSTEGNFHVVNESCI